MKKQSASSRSAARAQTKKRSTAEIKKSATAEELDAMHDAGVDMSAYMDYENARRPGRDVQRVNVDFPLDMLHEIDRQAARHGVARQAYIKMMIGGVLRGWRGPEAKKATR